jgi:hypothetical protein
MGYAMESEGYLDKSPVDLTVEACSVAIIACWHIANPKADNIAVDIDNKPTPDIYDKIYAKVISNPATRGADLVKEYENAGTNKDKALLLVEAIIAYRIQAEKAWLTGRRRESWIYAAEAKFCAGALYGKAHAILKNVAIGQAGADKRHSQPDGYREQRERVVAFYRSKTWTSKDACAWEAVRKFGGSFSTLRGYLRNI